MLVVYVVIFNNYSVTSWTELLPMLEKKFGPDKGYMFVNNVFPTTVTNPTTHVWQNVTGVNILAYLYREPFLKKTKYMNFKVIVNPRAVFSTSIHGLLKSKHGQSWIDRNIAQMYHTR